MVVNVSVIVGQKLAHFDQNVFRLSIKFVVRLLPRVDRIILVLEISLFMTGISCQFCQNFILLK